MAISVRLRNLHKEKVYSFDEGVDNMLSFIKVKSRYIRNIGISEIRVK